MSKYVDIQGPSEQNKQMRETWFKFYWSKQGCHNSPPDFTSLPWWIAVCDNKPDNILNFSLCPFFWKYSTDNEESFIEYVWSSNREIYERNFIFHFHCISCCRTFPTWSYTWGSKIARAFVGAHIELQLVPERNVNFLIEPKVECSYWHTYLGSM